jgi:glycosyltransferase involved in cell wall biosynthesis
MSGDRVSCIVPVFNGERYLAQAIESVLQQTRAPCEIVVADDGSTDGTPDLARGYGPPVRYVRQDNAGPAAARNLGLRTARGDLIGFLDADDLWHRDKLARQLEFLAARPEVDACVCHMRHFWEDEVRDEAESFRDHRIARPIPAYSSVALLAPRGLFERIGPFDEKLAHADDTEWFLRARSRGAVIELLPEVLAFRRLHRGNRSRRRSAASHDEYLRLLKAHLDRRR